MFNKFWLFKVFSLKHNFRMEDFKTPQDFLTVLSILEQQNHYQMCDGGTH